MTWDLESDLSDADTYYPDYSIEKVLSRKDENNEFFGLELLLYKEDGSLVAEGEKVCCISSLIFNIFCKFMFVSKHKFLIYGNFW